MNIKQLVKYNLVAGIGIMSVTTSFAASAVAVNKTTGAYGYAYGKKTEAEAKTAAIANCSGGGEVIASSPKDGHGAILRNVNNWKDGQPVVVKAILGQADPVGIRKPGSGECPDCLFVEIWYDNALSTDAEKFTAVGGKKGPEELKVDLNNRRNGEYLDNKVIDGREFKNGIGMKYRTPDTKVGLMNKTEYYMGLCDGRRSNYDFTEGMDPILVSEVYYKDGWQTGFRRVIGRIGSIERYEEYKKGVLDGFFYRYNMKGQLEEKGYYKVKQKHGIWQMYSSTTGLLSEKGRYIMGQKDGEWLSYEADGKTVRKKKNYVNGVMMN
jgi:antitoxin component YwqK of YwqJK toxin-antitoxin module